MFYLYRNVYIDARLLSLKAECDYSACGGACCTGEGYGTPLNQEDIVRIEKEVMRLDWYEYRKGPRLVCRENGDCNFFNNGRCDINEFKPDFCCLFPVMLERRNGQIYMIFQPYSECAFRKSEKHFLSTLFPVLQRIFGNEFVKGLPEVFDDVQV